MCAVTELAHIQIPADAGAARRARDFLREAHCDHHAAHVLEPAQLLVSELVTNSARHGAPPIVVEVSCGGVEGMLVRVSDGSTGLPKVQAPTDHGESGRGMALVDLLSHEWGVQPGGDGKTVWFTIRAQAAV